MENRDCMGPSKHGSFEELPSLFKYIASKSLVGFDTTPSPRMDPTYVIGAEATDIHNPAGVISMLSQNSPILAKESYRSHNISISMPASPSGFQVEQANGVLFNDEAGTNDINGQSNDRVGSNVVNLQQLKKAKFHSQPINAGVSYVSATTENIVSDSVHIRHRLSRNDRLKDKRFDSFKTWSGKLEWPRSNLRGRPQEHEEVNGPQMTEPEAVPAVDRYFDALEGPELDTLKASEELVLPEDKKWPFLLRFPISSFGMCLGISSQAILWKTLATSPPTMFLHVSPTINLALWCIALALTGIVSLVYSLKIIFYFEAVRREYYHPIRVNFFFAPWITCLFLSIGVPPSVAVHLHDALWYALMAPILCLQLKIYGQWMSGGQRRLSKVANPSNHLSVVGNFVGALLGASMGLKEGPIFFFAVGLAHYAVLFVTLYQRLPTNETLPKELHPVFFLFVAAPSVACTAWATITGDFGYGSRIAYFVALFLYTSLAVRINFFRGFRFSLAWWAYTFPMTGASIATIRYATEVENYSTQGLSLFLSGISTLTVMALLVSTILHAFVLHDLFPNDISIAITERKTKSSKRHAQLGTASSDTKDVGACSSIDTDIVLEVL